MTKDQIKAVLDRVLTWPPERQQEAAEILTSMESQHSSDYRLSEEQVIEVRQRQAEKAPKTLGLDEFNDRLRRQYKV